MRPQCLSRLLCRDETLAKVEAIAKVEALSCDGGSEAHHKQLDKSIRAIYKKYIIIYQKYMESSHG